MQGNVIFVGIFGKKLIFLQVLEPIEFIPLGNTLIVNQRFKVRFRSHKSTMLTKKNTCEVAIHFNKEKRHF